MSAVLERPRRQRHRFGPEARAAILAAVRSGVEPLKAYPPERLSEWAARHFKLAGESSHQKGAWEAWPFQVGWMDAFSNDDIEHVDVQKSKRVGYTKTLVAFVAYNVAHRRRKQALWQPTDDDRDSFVKSEIEPILDGVQAVRRLRRRGRGVEDTIKYKAFRGSVAHFLGGKAARAYRRITVAVAMLDEWSGFDQQIEKSSDPGTLAKGRLEGAPYPKFIGGSTPRLKGLDHVERSREEAVADVRYHITCPHCGVEHPLMWGGKDVAHGFKWDNDDPETVRHVCPHCRGSINQGDYLRNWVGSWVCVKTGVRYGSDRTWLDAAGQPMRAPRHVGFQVWAAYSPQREWVDIVREFLKAHKALQAGDSGPMQGFVNETLGETWEEKGESADEHVLARRAEIYPLGVVPKGALMLTAGCDLQGNRLEIAVWGWGRQLESWDIDHVVIELNPANEDDWNSVEQHLMRRYTQAWHGGSLGLDAVSIDSNYQTQAVFNFVRKMQHRMRVYAVRGEGAAGLPIKGPGRPQDVNWRGQKWAQGIKQWSVGTDSAMDLIHGQLQIEHPGPGYVHLNKGRSREWFEQLTAEQRIQVKGPAGTVERWVKRRPRNEVVDCRKYALHAAYMLGLNSYSDKQWLSLESAVQPPPDLFSAPAAASAPEVPTTALELVAAAAAAAAPRAPASSNRQRHREW